MSTGPILTWLITGASSGLGLSLATEALRAGHKVVGTTRDVAAAHSSNPGLSAKGGIWVHLDPSSPDAYEKFRKCAEEHDVDVLVNNAGYAFIGGIEDTSEDEVRQQMEVNFYGPLRAIRACLPTMRAKRSGHMVLISSAAGIFARPARSTYSASKFAMEAVHESLAQEVQSFGIKVLIVEPGAFRTPFASRIIVPAQYSSTGGYSETYKDTVVEQLVRGTRGMAAMPDFVRGDPDKAARAILDAVSSGDYSYLRMPLGNDCLALVEAKIGQLQGDLNATRRIASNTDID